MKTSYVSGRDDLVRDFLKPVLKKSKEYRRGVGFFASSVFQLCWPDWRNFFDGGGQVRIVCSHRFSSESDIEALFQGTFYRGRFLEGYPPIGKQETPDLAYLVALGLVRLKVAVPVGRARAMFHEKVGVCIAPNGEPWVAYSGSANESAGAYIRNIERIEVFFPGSEPKVYFQGIRSRWQALWDNYAPSLRVMSLAEAFRSGNVVCSNEPMAEEKSRQVTMERSRHLECPIMPDGVALYDHQRKAMDKWAGGGGRGIFEMATGSGKTITALSIATRLYERLTAKGHNTPLVILIVAPQLNIVEQWVENARRFGLNPIQADSEHKWREPFSSAVNACNLGTRSVLSVVTTNDTLKTEAFQSLLSRVRCTLFLIADEVHNLGTQRLLRALPERCQFRLGLSATPERWRDNEGTTGLLDYFGDVVFRYGMKEALDDGVLTPYRYHPVFVELSDDEADVYTQLSQRINSMTGAEDELSDATKMLLIRRARIVSAAEAKLPALIRLMRQLPDQSHILVYCGDGTVEGEGGDVARQVDEAVRLIGSELNLRCDKYTSETTPSKRRDLIRHFVSGELQVLVAIRCLDEGVDIPSIHTAFILASTTNPRQYIQRRGRVLRRSPGKVRAQVFDFFVKPVERVVDTDNATYQAERRLFANQLARAEEFATLAENSLEARRPFTEIRASLDLLGED